MQPTTNIYIMSSMHSVAVLFGRVGIFSVFTVAVVFRCSRMSISTISDAYEALGMCACTIEMTQSDQWGPAMCLSGMQHYLDDSNVE